jgi:hypothetical protein
MYNAWGTEDYLSPGRWPLRYNPIIHSPPPSSYTGTNTIAVIPRISVPLLPAAEKEIVKQALCQGHQYLDVSRSY